MIKQPLVIEQKVEAGIDKVWAALTDKEQMKTWYFDIADFEPKAGFEFTFEGENEGRKFTHLCKIIEVVRNKKLSYSWRYKGFEGISYVSFELFDEGDGTRITLTHEGLETFPQNNPDFKKENFAEGWNYILGTALKNYLQNEAV